MHLALEGYHGYDLDPVAVLHWAYQDLIAQHPGEEQQLRKDLDMALAIIEGYVQWSLENGIDANLDVVATEHELTHRVTLPRTGQVVEWRGKLDVLFQRRDTHQYQCRDYKTVAGFTKANLLILDTQMRFYSMLLAFAFPEAADRTNEVLYLMLKRSKRTARAVGPFFEQAAVAYNRHDLNATYLRSLAITEEIVSARESLDGTLPETLNGRHHYTVYPSPSDFCSWGCIFARICPMFDDGSRVEDAVSALYVQADPYQYYSEERISRARAALEKGTA